MYKGTGLLIQTGVRTMKNKILTLFSFLSVILLFITASFAENPVVQTNFTADPAPMVYNDTVFLYTGHDEDTTPASGFFMHNYLLYTSTDLVNWQDRGIVASLKNFSWAPGNGAWAAQVIYRNGKFYYYCAIQGYGIGVLVANTPYGPFTDPLGHALLNHSWNDIDPTVFIDDDNQAYMYWGNPQCYWVRLNADMISYSGRIDSIPRPNTYQEGPWFYKRNGHYYLAWASTCCPEGIGYAMATAATGPWTYKGSIMDGNSGSSGNHPGIIDYKGKSYVFGFNYAINFSLTTVHRERRSVCLAEMPYNTDGTIPKLPWWGGNLPEAGVAQIGTFNPYDTAQAETMCFERGVRTEVCSDVGGGIDVDSIHNGDFIKVKGVDFGSGANSFIARVASATSGGNIELRLDTTTGTLVGTCAVIGTTGWQTWATRTCAVTGATGVHNLFLRFTGGSGLLFNVNWWKFNSATGIGSAIEKNTRYGNSLKIRTCSGTTTSLQLDFPQPVIQGNLNVRLFDLTGRLVATLFSGHLSAPHLILPLKRGEIRTGAYLIKISLDNNILIKNRMIFNK
jgi:arabinoxylan arabinofuranohydrolase